jgi:hypothetical protein
MRLRVIVGPYDVVSHLNIRQRIRYEVYSGSFVDVCVDVDEPLKRHVAHSSLLLFRKAFGILRPVQRSLPAQSPVYKNAGKSDDEKVSYQHRRKSNAGLALRQWAAILNVKKPLFL